MKDKFLENLEIKYDSIEWNHVYIKSIAKYYWLERKKFLSVSEMCHNNLLTTKEVIALRSFWLVETFDDITYKVWGEKWKFNMLDDSIILKPSNTPVLHSDIEELLFTVCWWEKENIDYLHKAIYYKYLNINDVNIPAIILHWAWGSWKWTLMSMFETIYWSDNVLKNLGQRELTWNFDVYKWQKIIVEFAEITTWNHYSDVRVINKLKNIVWSDILQVNEKGIPWYQISNIAWFFISSNSNVPIRLDSKEAGNRRFNVIRSKHKLQDWARINQSISNKKIVSDYLSWLELHYSEVLKLDKLENLENNDKKALEDLSQVESNNFWDWYIMEYPEIVGTKLKLEDIQSMIKEYCDIFSINYNDMMKYFWNTSRYIKTKLRIWEKTFYGVKIP